MTNYQRVTAKVFGETATATGTNPEIAQFGSALAGNFTGTTDIATIQNLSAWSNGFIDCVTPSTQFPPLPEMTGVGKVITHQQAYLLQKGVAEWDSGTIYYINDLCKGININNEVCIYKSKIDNNLNNQITDTNYWLEIPIEQFANKQTKGDWCVTEPTTISTATIDKPVVIIENYRDGADWCRVYSDGWCEQGGSNFGTEQKTTTTVNLNSGIHKPYKDTNYSISLTFNVPLSDTSQAYNYVAGADQKTTNSFGVHGYKQGSGTPKVSVLNSYDWVTRGYINT